MTASNEFGQHTTGRQVVERYADQVKGRTIVITGASQGGIGAETAVALAYGKPSSLVLAGRSTSDIKPTIERIREVDPTVEVVCIDLDLSDQVSVRSAVDQVKSKFEKLDILINNAAVMCVYPYRETKQGIEMQFGTNHVGHFLWTNLLLPLLTRSERGGARIINVSSTGYVLHDVPDDVNFNNGEAYHPWKSYGVSKSANILFSQYLHSRLKSSGIFSFALQPGVIQTNIGATVKDEGPTSLAAAYQVTKDAGPVPESEQGEAYKMEEDVKTLEEGCSTTLYAALSTDLDQSSPIFYRNCRPFGLMKRAQSQAKAESLWKLSEELVGEKFEL